MSYNTDHAITLGQAKEALIRTTPDPATYNEVHAMLLEKLGSGSTAEVGNTNISLPPNDNTLYGMKNGNWTAILSIGASGISESSGTTPTPAPETQQINQEGEANVTFFIPWKFATNSTRTALNDYGHMTWLYPFNAGTVKKVSLKAKTPDSVGVDVLVDGSSVLGEPKTVTTSWVDYNVNTPILLNQPIEIYVTQRLLACDLTVSITMDVGNKVLEFYGESDIQPNVYVRGVSAATFGADGQNSPDGQFRSVYMPSVNNLKSVTDGFLAQGDDGKWYVCSTKQIYGVNSSQAPTTPIELAVSNIKDITMDNVGDGYPLYPIYLYKDGTLRRSSTEKSNVLQLPENDNYSISENYYVTLDGRHAYFGATGANVEFPVGTTIKKMLVTGSTVGYCLLDNGEIWEVTGYNNTQKITFNQGTPKDIFGVHSPFSSGAYTQVKNSLFVVTTDNELYARGYDPFGHLGLSPVEGMMSESGSGATTPGGAYYNDFTKVGVWDVKDIQSNGYQTFMLTTDNKLYHAGAGYSSSATAAQQQNYITQEHTAFTQIFENYRFYDIAYAPYVSNSYYGTLITIAEYLGEVVA